MIRKVFYVWLSLKGRINRKTYLLFYIIPVILLFIISWTIAVSFGTPGPGEEPESVRYTLSMEDNFVATLVFFLLFFTFFVGLTWGYLATGVKRLHDLGFSGWTLLVSLIPILGFVVVFALVFVRGDVGENRFGPIEGT
jgi:uncharacterized membrane protein YhaH (DUF805 family)